MARRTKENDPRPLVHLEVEGRRIPAREGEPLTASLLAAGVEILSRGVKYHRARGPYCLTGRCAHCLVRVDGEPNVAACQVAVRDGMRVERQNAFPSATHDVFTTIDWMYPRGMDHHSLFPGVPVVEKVVAKVARHMAGLGTLPDSAHSRDARYAEHATEVLVVGGGAAGLAAAVEAARAGAEVTLLDDQPEPGTGLLAPLHGGGPSAAWRDEALRALERDGARILSSTFVFGLFREDGSPSQVPWAAARGPKRTLLVVRPRALVLATGANELLPLFPNNDLPGIFGARALATLIERDGVVPGERALVAGDGPEAEAVSGLLRRHGCEIVASVGLEPGPRGHVVRARGRGRLAGAILRMADGTEQKIRIDLMAVAGHRSGFVDLARHAGAEIRFGDGGFFVAADDDGRTRVPGVFACGEVSGRRVPEEAARQGAAAGRAAAAFVREEAPA
jgi:sarcosine oxidase subunit alpha